MTALGLVPLNIKKVVMLLNVLGERVFSVMFRNVLKMKMLNNFNHNGRYKTSLSIVSWLAITSMESTYYRLDIKHEVCNLLKLWRA